MYSLSERSLKNLEGVHPDLVRVVKKAMSLQLMDFSVSEGVRSLERQRELVSKGNSRTMRSKHLVQNTGFGHAVDLYPHPVDMDKVAAFNPREIARFGVLIGIMRTCALIEGVQMVNGIDWDGDGQTLDHTFFDAPHFELVGAA